MTNPLAAAQQTLPELHDDTMREELRLLRIQGADPDHFQRRINQALAAMTENCRP